VVLIKRMAQLSDPVFAVLLGYVFCSLFITPYALYRSAAHFRQIGRYWKSFVGMGAAGTLATWFGTTAYTLTLSSYVEAVKQIEILLALALGYLFFQEGPRIRLIWAGTVVIMAGMLLLKLGD
ncbi:MAG TPA: EamA family transporter, partial [Anaerolineae bacterium]